MEAGQREYDPEKRANLLKKAAALVWEDSPRVWLYLERFLVAHSAGIKNLVVSPLKKIYPQAVVME